MNRIDNFLMKPVTGIIRNMVDIHSPYRSVMGLPFTLHNFATRNFTTRRTNILNYSPSIRYHKSRMMKY